VSEPRYPDIRLSFHSRNPLVWVSEVRQALRRSGATRDEIQRFSASALAARGGDDTLRICTAWADVRLL